MSKEGRLIENFDPKPAVQKNAESAHDWEYSEEAQFLYGMAVLFKDRLLDPILRTERGRLPDPVISFDDLRNKKTLAAYPSRSKIISRRQGSSVPAAHRGMLIMYPKRTPQSRHECGRQGRFCLAKLTCQSFARPTNQTT